MNKSARSLYVLGVVVVTFGALWLVSHIPSSLVLLLQKSTGELVVSVSHFLGLTAQYTDETQLFHVAGFNMLLGPECVALHYWVILTLAIVFYPGQSFCRRVLGWLSASSLLVLFNITRLIILGLVGAHYPDLFDAVHDYVWQVAFAFVTVLLCFFWTEKSTLFIYPLVKVVFGGMVFSGLFALILESVRSVYLNALVFFSDKGLLLLAFDLPWASRKWAIMNKSFVMLRLDGSLLEYAFPGNQYTVNMWLDVLALALFWGGCASLLFWSSMKSKKNLRLRHFFMSVVGGTFVLLALQVSTLLILGKLLNVGDSNNLARNFLWFMRSLSVVCPLFMCWLVWVRTSKTGQSETLTVFG